MSTTLRVELTNSNVLASQLRWWFGTAVILLLIGLTTRMLPLLLGGDLLYRQFITEDGYLMLTVARNIAVGKGMSVADGLIPTNGVQPLATFLYAGCFWLANGDRALGLVFVHVVSIVTAAGSAALIVSLARAMVTEWHWGWALGLLAAGIWFSAPLILQHSMNGLETGLYFFVIAALANLLVRWFESPAQRWSWWRLMLWSLLSGVAFWTRNDAVFFVAAFCLVWLLAGLHGNSVRITRRISEVFVIGLATLLLAAPWLVYNYSMFGSIVPISGIAESLGAEIGQNAYLVPVKLAEHIMFFLPIPASLENSSIVGLASLIITFAFLAGLGFAYRASESSNRMVILIFCTFGMALVFYYGVLFGAPYFLSRYLASLTPVAVIASAAGLLLVCIEFSRRGWSIGIPIICATIVSLAFALNLRLWIQGHDHEHFQVVQWVEQNVGKEEWVGAVQTGTLGFFHDRTINLDGKVNPIALRALKEGKVLDYVVNSEIKYLVDWVGITDWGDREEANFREHFEVLIKDTQKNLGVLRRIRNTVPRT